MDSASSRAFTALLKGKYSYVARAWNRLFGGPESPFLHGQLLPPNSTLTPNDILTLTCDPFFYQLHEFVHNATNAGTKRKAITRAIQYASDILHRNLTPTPISISELTPRRESSSVGVTVDYDNENDNAISSINRRLFNALSSAGFDNRQPDQQKGRNQMGTWKTNTGELKQGMTVRLPGTRKELNVISVKGGEAKLDNGERISARSEVEILTIPPPESRPSSPTERLKAQAAARRREEDDEDEVDDDNDPDDDGNDGWNVNDSEIGLEKGMLICRFGKDEELPVVRIKGGRAVVKLQSGALADVDCHDRKITWKWPDDVVSKMREREQESRRKAAVSARDLREQEQDEEEAEDQEPDREQEPEEEGEEHDERTAAEDEDEREETQSNKVQPQTTTTRTPSGDRWYKLEELSSLTGHHWSKINKIRKAGELPKGSFKEDGRSILYNEDAREYLSGVEKDRRGRRHDHDRKEKEQVSASPREQKDDEDNGETVRHPSRDIPTSQSRPEPLRRSTNLVPAGGVLGVLDIAIERASNEIEEALDKVKKLKVLIETLKEQRRQF